MTEPHSRQEQLVLQLLDIHEQPSTRASAAAALAACEVDRFIMCIAIPALDAAAAEELDVSVRAAARSALDKILGEFKESPAIRRRVIESFGPSPSLDPADLPLILTTLVDAHATVRKATVTLVKNAFAHTPYTVVEGMDQVIERIADTLSDVNVEVRREAALALGAVRWELINDQLRLEEDPSLVRRLSFLSWAIDAFTRVAVPFLSAASSDADTEVRTAADDTLLIVPHNQSRRELVPDLVRLSTDEDVSVRCEAVIALGCIFERCDGDERDRIIAALASAANDPRIGRLPSKTRGLNSMGKIQPKRSFSTERRNEGIQRASRPWKTRSITIRLPS